MAQMSDIHHTFVILEKGVKGTSLNAAILMAEGLSKLTENNTHVVYHLKDRGQMIDELPDPHARIPALYHDYSSDDKAA